MSQKTSQPGWFLEGADGVLAWLPELELIGRMAVVKLDLEETADAAAE